jgi:hypothetical protein
VSGCGANRRGHYSGRPWTKPAVRHMVCTVKCQPIVSSTNAGDRAPKPCADCAIRTVVARMSGTIASSLLNQVSDANHADASPTSAAWEVESEKWHKTM